MEMLTIAKANAKMRKSENDSVCLLNKEQECVQTFRHFIVVLSGPSANDSSRLQGKSFVGWR